MMGGGGLGLGLGSGVSWAGGRDGDMVADGDDASRGPSQQ